MVVTHGGKRTLVTENVAKLRLKLQQNASLTLDYSWDLCQYSSGRDGMVFHECMFLQVESATRAQNEFRLFHYLITEAIKSQILNLFTSILICNVDMYRYPNKAYDASMVMA